ncbi:MAG: HD domain-containing phosphohydrolase [Gammaproteobacteria bacterium]
MPYNGLKSDDLKHAVEALDIALEERDRYTRQHCHRLVSLSGKTGALCGLNEDELHAIKVAALFHDIGKIGIPDSILLKTMTLDADEWETIKTHSEKGERIIGVLKIKNGWDIAKLIRNHHEHFNGKGYPDGLSGENIPFGARVISVVDSYDAMTSTRSYSHARTHDQTLAIMHEEEGEKSDPYVFRQFLRAIGKGTAGG